MGGVQNALDVKPATAATGCGPSDSDLVSRFVTANDQSAFRALADRYGGIVWSVCRRILTSREDAEDAFQAVFLIFARRGHTIKTRGSVGSWLYGVAYRTAMKSRRNLSRRFALERKAKGASPEREPDNAAAGREFQRLVDQEVNRLPERLKIPFVLCCIKGMSRAEAAAEVGWNDGTLSSRLAEARKRLQKQLLRRGVTLSAALTVLSLANTATASVPVALIQTTTTGAASGTLSPGAVSLADGVMRSLVVAKLKTVGAAILALTITTAGAMMATGLLGDPPSNPTVAQKRPLRHLVFVEPPAPFRPQKIPGNPNDAIFHPVSAMAVSPKGDILAIGGQGKSIELFETWTGQKLGALNGHKDAIKCLAFSPDGAMLASGSADHDVRIWNAANGKLMHQIERHSAPVTAVAFSPDGKTLATAGGVVIHLWEPRSNTHLKELLGHEEGVSSLAFSRDGKLLASGGVNGSILVWPEKGDEPRRLPTQVKAVRALVFADDELVSGDDNATIKIWQPATGKEPYRVRRTLEGHPGHICALAYLDATDVVISACTDGAIMQWGLIEGERRHVLKGHSSAVVLAIPPAGTELLSGGDDGKTLRWRTEGTPRPEAVPPVAVAQKQPPPSPKKLIELKEFFQDFRGSKSPEAPVGIIGIKANLVARPDEKGLHIAVSANKEQQERIGVDLPARFHGDFEITASYEFAKLEQPAEGHGVGVSLIADLDSNAGEFVEILRLARADEGNVFGTVRKTNVAGQDRYEQEWHPTASNAGQLRITRRGENVTFSAREGGSTTFKELRKLSAGRDDVKRVRLAAFLGHAPNSIDVFLKDLRIAPPGTDVANKVDSSEIAAESNTESAKTVRGTTRLILVGSVLALLLGPLIWILWFRRKRSETQSSNVSTTATPPETRAVVCTNCGKKLRVRSTSAGKRVKCPQCDGQVVVPRDA